MENTLSAKTAYQWVKLGYVPKGNANFYKIDKSYTNYEGQHIESNYYYCNKEDCELNPEVAAKLLETAPLLKDCYTKGGNYDGRPWWCPVIDNNVE